MDLNNYIKDIANVLNNNSKSAIIESAIKYLPTEILFYLLLQKPKYELNNALVGLMTHDKIDFIDVSNAYTKALKYKAEKQESELIESETCALLSLMNNIKSGKSEQDEKARQWILYLLNKSKRFNMDDLNKKYSYNENIGKELSTCD